MRVVTQKLQSLSEGGPPSGNLATQLSDCRDEAASLRFALLIALRHAMSAITLW